MPSYEVVAVGAHGEVTGFSATLRLEGAVANGIGGSIGEAKSHAELAMWMGLQRKGGVGKSDSQDEINQEEGAGGGQAGRPQQICEGGDKGTAVSRESPESDGPITDACGANASNVTNAGSADRSCSRTNTV